MPINHNLFHPDDPNHYNKEEDCIQKANLNNLHLLVDNSYQVMAKVLCEICYTCEESNMNLFCKQVK